MLQKVGKIIFVLTVLIVVLLWTTQWMRGKKAFGLKHVLIEGNRLLSQHELLELASMDSSRDIFELDVNRVEERLKSHPMLKDVSVRRRFPASVKIKVNERKPLVVYYGKKIYGIDREGYLLSNMTPYMGYDTPVLSGFTLKTDSSEMRILSQEVWPVLEFLDEVYETDFTLYHKISEVSFHPKCGLVVYLMKEALPVLVGWDDWRRKSVYLSTILKKLEDENVLTQVEYLDLRFDRQIVVKEKTNSILLQKKRRFISS
ncbi:MAG: FtsQ-type POTRA domain-containing protein [candidate division KSB1 bacterium]|nr:FtsQ-type POTRA domain-containing protein [candidate division KSB1 bacterium]